MVSDGIKAATAEATKFGGTADEALVAKAREFDEAWAKASNIQVKLASDLNKVVIKQYDVVFPMLAGVGDTAARAAFVIDKNGVVQYSEQTPTPKDLPNFDAIKSTLEKLK